MINTLLNPIIIYWDLSPAETDDALNVRICDELLRARIFVLNLRDTSGEISETAMVILSQLKGRQLKINLTVMAGCLEDEALEDILRMDNVRVYIEFNTANELNASADRLNILREKGLDVGVSFYLSRENWKDLPAVTLCCGQNQIKELKIPIRRASDGTFYFSPEETMRISGELEGIDMSKLKMTIHDPFLWELFHGRENPNEEGCNAGRTMMYIDENYDLSPCPIMPVSLGSLRDSSLQELFVSEQRKQVRKDLAITPLDCTVCTKSLLCKGGCRGRAFIVHHTFNYQDPACPFNLTNTN